VTPSASVSSLNTVAPLIGGGGCMPDPRFNEPSGAVSKDGVFWPWAIESVGHGKEEEKRAV
jgi:hypothetical protein